MQLVYDFLYKRHSPTFLIFLCTGHSDYPVDSDYPLKYSMPKFKDFTIVMVWAYIGGNSLKGPLFIWDRDNLGNINSRSYT